MPVFAVSLFYPSLCDFRPVQLAHSQPGFPQLPPVPSTQREMKLQASSRGGLGTKSTCEEDPALSRKQAKGDQAFLWKKLPDIFL